MFSVYKLKPQFQALLQPVLLRLHQWGFSPNLLTLLGILLSLAMGLYAFYGERKLALILMPVVLLLRMALNALDGMMARQFNLQSKIGAALNEMGDVVSDIVLYYPLYVLFALNQIWILCFLLLCVLNEFAGLLGQALGGERRYDGPMGKSDRALAVGVLSLLILFKAPIYWYLTWIWMFVFCLLIWSTLKRLKHAVR
ncbi:MAG: CDP-alcohol phosphatidyltransferase family protein [Flavobacteriales bacterium]